MVNVNVWTIFVAAIIPMVIGFAWYNPKTFGTAWMKETGVTEESAQNANMALTFGLAYVFACMLAFTLLGMCCHQMGLLQLFASEEGFKLAGSEVQEQFKAILAQVGDRHLSFGHGALHGVIAGLFFALPVLATNALFEMKSWKYIWINVGYWVVCCGLMGAFLCQYGITIS